MLLKELVDTTVTPGPLGDIDGVTFVQGIYPSQ